MVKRRTILASAVTAFLAGCSGGDGGAVGGTTATRTEDPTTESETETATPTETRTRTPTRTPTETSSDGGLEKVGSGDGEGKGTGTPPDGPKSKADPTVLFDRTVTLPAGERHEVRFSPTDPVVLEYKFGTVPLPVDAVLMTEGAYSEVGVVADPEYVEKGTVLDSEGDSVRARLDPADGGYVLVFDNTDLGEADPGSNATLDDEVELTASVSLFGQ